MQFKNTNRLNLRLRNAALATTLTLSFLSVQGCSYFGTHPVRIYEKQGVMAYANLDGGPSRKEPQYIEVEIQLDAADPALLSNLGIFIKDRYIPLDKLGSDIFLQHGRWFSVDYTVEYNPKWILLDVGTDDLTAANYVSLNNGMYKFKLNNGNVEQFKTGFQPDINPNVPLPYIKDIQSGTVYAFPLTEYQIRAIFGEPTTMSDSRVFRGW